MSKDEFRLGYEECRTLLRTRLAEPAPGLIQLVSGPRQVGKTTLLLDLASELGERAVYAAADGPEASLPGFFERLFLRAAEASSAHGRAVVLLDEAHLLTGWAARLKGEWDRLRRLRSPVHVVATGSSALRLAAGSKASLTGRFERIVLRHWSAAELASTFGLAPEEAAEAMVREGGYPGAMGFRGDPARFRAYVRDAIVEPAIGSDLLALGRVRKPALLRQVFMVCVGAPACIVSLDKIRGRLSDRGALETVAGYLALLEDAFLVAALPKHSPKLLRQRAAPPKLVVLSNAILAALDPAGPPDPRRDPGRFGAWVENACLAHAVNRGLHVAYWREEPLEVDAVLCDGPGPRALEVKTGRLTEVDLRPLLAFCQRFPTFRPLLVGDDGGRRAAERAGVEFAHWRDFLLLDLRP